MGAVTAKKIIEGRPYASVKGLSKAGLSAGQIEKITPFVMARRSAASNTRRTATETTDTPPSRRRATAADREAKAGANGRKLDLNSATASSSNSFPASAPLIQSGLSTTVRIRQWMT